jgi:outer membrane protein OmpU
MKKILLATTLIAASTGFAAAEVAVSGSARMGVTTDTPSGEAQFSSRVRIVFTASGETDGGLSFGASMRADQNGGNASGTENGDSTVYISGAFGKLTMGDTGNAVDSLLGQVSGVGYIGLSDKNEINFLNKDITGAQYEYAAGALSFALGLGQASAAEDFLSAAVKYSTDAYSIGLGYEDNNSQGSAITVAGSASMAGATVKAKVVDSDVSADLAYAMSVDYAISGVGVTAFYSDNAKFDGLAAYGLGASYDLGGGAAVKGGVARTEGSDTVAEVGVTMSF